MPASWLQNCSAKLTKRGQPRCRTFAQVLLLLAVGAPFARSQDFAAWQWQRVIRPAPDSPVTEQCVVLDADLYASATPGLRDVRLLQDGRLLAYALQESYDSGALDTHSPARILEDRSVYTTVLRVQLTPGAANQTGEALLRQHVPVERIELVPVGDAAEVQFRISAKPHSGEQSRTRAAPLDPELVNGSVSAGSPVIMTALGANLQSDADVAITLSGKARFTAALLQMHQRAVCYQPLSRSEIVLLFGNPDAPPVHYEYATHFHPLAKPLLASMSQAEPNPAFRGRADRRRLTLRAKLFAAFAITGAAFLLTVLPLLRKGR